MADLIQQAAALYGGAVAVIPGGVTVQDAAALRGPATDRLVWQAVFADEAEREAARWLLWEIGQVQGVRPASIHELYLARGRGECSG
ncbi:MAG TPA: aldolase, partial [Gemmatimonadales bacterium]